jgi:ABC-type cobalamin/Fe3+-siderophores transport system ATPase subunit
MHLKRVRLKNVRGIREAEFELPGAGWHVVLGDNGSGKTTLIRGIVLGVLGGGSAPKFASA